MSGWLADKLHVAPWTVAAGLVVFWLAPAIADRYRSFCSTIRFHIPLTA